MHDIEPYYKWRDYYTAEKDECTPFYGRTYSEFQYSQKIYNYFIHPQWDFYGSITMCMKILFIDYDKGVALIELLGEWNDCITNDVMIMKRDVIDQLLSNGISKFVLFCDNVLNYHSGEDDYYQEWYEDISDDEGWICFMNLNEHVLKEMEEAKLQHFVMLGNQFNNVNWRGLIPRSIVTEVERIRDVSAKQLN